MPALCQRRWHFATDRKPGGFVQNWGEACQVGRRRPRQKLPGGRRVGRGARRKPELRWASTGSRTGYGSLATSLGSFSWAKLIDRRIDAEGCEEHLFPRRAAKGREEHLFPRRAAKGRGEHLFPRRAAKGRGEHLFSTEGREGSRRTPFPTEGREGPRRTPFSTEGREGSRRTPFSTEGREGPRRTPFPTEGREGPRRTPSLSAKGREEHLFPRRATKGRGEHLFCPRRVAKDTVFHRGPRRAHKNTFLDPRRHAEGREFGQECIESLSEIARPPPRTVCDLAGIGLTACSLGFLQVCNPDLGC